MALDLEKFRIVLNNITTEEMEYYFPADTTPKGWISIEDHLPTFKAKDIIEGCTYYKVKFDNDAEGVSCVADHYTWYYYAKSVHITHWWNE